MGYTSFRRVVVAPCLILLLRRSNAFVVPGGGRATHVQNTGSLDHEQHRIRHSHSRLRVLCLAPRVETKAGGAEQEPGDIDGGELSGREAMEQAGERLIPLFAQVDARTERWVIGW